MQPISIVMFSALFGLLPIVFLMVLCYRHKAVSTVIDAMMDVDGAENVEETKR